MGLPPLTHPDIRPDLRPGPLVARCEWNGEHDPHALGVGNVRDFGPFQSVWLWADTLIGRGIDNQTEYVIARYRVSKGHGGGVWKAEDGLYYTDVVFHLIAPDDPLRPVDPWRHERLEDWRYAVSNGDTLRGFAAWLHEEAE